MALARAVEVHMRQVSASATAAEDAGATMTQVANERVLRAVSALCDDMKERLRSLPEDPVSDTAAAGDPSASGRSYSVLRESLVTSQRRCATLNEDMLRLASKNEELVSTMQSVKATNRRLVDQIQSQSDEIAKLTQLRLADEENLEQVMQKNQVEVEEWHREVQQRLDEEETQADTKFQEKKQQLMAKLSKVQDGLQSLSAATSEIQNARSRIGAEIKTGFADWRTDVLDKLLWRFSESAARQRRAEEVAITQLEDDAHDLATKLAVEREARERETATWERRERELIDEEKSLAETFAADLAQLQVEIAATKAARESETSALDQDRNGSTERLRDLAVHVASLDAMVRTAQGSKTALEAQCMRSNAEYMRLDGELQSANHKIRETDECLHRAVASNESLKRQMTEQSLEAQTLCDKVIAECNEAFEAKIEKLVAEQQDEMLSLNRKVTDLERATAQKATEVARVHLDTEKASEERSRLQRDATHWRAQEELATKLQAEVEHQLAEARTAWGKQLQVLREQQEATIARQLQLEGEIQTAQETIAEVRHGAEIRLSQAQAYTKSLDAQIREAGEELRDVKRVLSEKVAALTAARSDISARHAASLEARHELERSLQTVMQEKAEKRDQLIMEAAAERQRRQKAQLECDHMRQQNDAAILEAQSGSMAQLMTLDQQIAELQDRHRSDMHHANLKLEANRKQIELLETEINRVQDGLNEAERRLQADTAIMRTTRTESTSTIMRLEAERTSAQEKLAHMKEQERKLATEVDEKQRTTNSERSRLTRELTDLMKNHDQQVRDAAARLDTLRMQHESELHQLEGRRRIEAEQQQHALEAAQAENCRLRRLVGETRDAARAVGAARGEVQDKLTRMMRRSDQLNKELQGRSLP
eukprot:gnl/TRDRNA2_/TRDRNA2_173910_c1_seq1.p1 gnl/TRDRNA2_/TRDRNA2_173910_c1~~gnl/TRDRNA2_/TRDRNA2_173910_c1_seq1.p1  ORF type:complete len:887 (-),score=249.06 gnl/TRDRNA2_/TRDRNA2_173910_c1_seq1:76-2736(-)